MWRTVCDISAQLVLVWLVIPTHVVASNFSNLMGCILLHQLPFQVSCPVLECILPLILALEDMACRLFCFRGYHTAFLILLLYQIIQPASWSHFRTTPNCSHRKNTLAILYNICCCRQRCRGCCPSRSTWWTRPYMSAHQNSHAIQYMRKLRLGKNCPRD